MLKNKNKKQIYFESHSEDHQDPMLTYRQFV